MIFKINGVMIMRTEKECRLCDNNCEEKIFSGICIQCNTGYENNWEPKELQTKIGGQDE